MTLSTLKLNFYKFRALFFLYLLKLLAKIFFVEFPPLFSVAALIEKKGKLLFLDLSYQNGLGLPGGMVESGETLKQALERELKEETDLNVKKAAYFTSVASASYLGLPMSSVIFLVETEGQPKASVEGELLWLKPKVAKDKLFYEDAKLAIEEYLTQK